MYQLCYTDPIDFANIQGVGSDPMYKRYDSVFSVIKNRIDERYRSFLARPHYENDLIYWYVEKWEEIPQSLKDLEGPERQKYERIKEETVSHYKSVLESLKSEEYAILSGALKFIDDDFIYCYDDKVVLVAWGMCPDTNKRPVNGKWVMGLKMQEKFKITFDPGTEGHLENSLDRFLNRVKGSRLTKRDIPAAIANEGYEFTGWSPDPLGFTVNGDMSFHAQYSKIEDPGHRSGPDPENFNVRFDAGEHGTVSGTSQFSVPQGHVLTSNEIPGVSPMEGYRFTGWSIDPGLGINGDTVFEAQYEANTPPPPPIVPVPWYKRRWFKWLIGILIFIALLLLILYLLRGCCHNDVGDIHQADKVELEDGTLHDDNGDIGSITDDDGNIDAGAGISPIVGGDGSTPPIESEPGQPDVISNRLNIFFDDDNPDLNKWAKEFKRLYPGDSYQIIGVDSNVPLIQIMIPESKRDEIRENLPGQITDPSFFVVDESVIYDKGHDSADDDPSLRGWHLKAVHAEEAWKITRGSRNVIVAIVDDGIDANHPMLKGRYYKPYNVFTQNNTLSVGNGHGTHVAGLAAGSTEFLSEGAAGIAPECRIMPIQVFDNGLCSFSALASGILYAIHNGADVVNISIGLNLSGIDSVPLDEQLLMGLTEFKNEEKVYNHIFELAEEKNVILVFAAGNDNIMTYVLPNCRSENTINVSAVTPQIKATAFTNYAIGSTISAPGQSIYSSYPVNALAMLDGTSMAAPIVTGAVALLRSVKPDVTVKEVVDIFEQTGQETDQYVPKMIIIDEALKMLRGSSVGGGGSGSGSDIRSGDETEGDDTGTNSDLIDELNRLRAQRDALNRQISDLEQKIGGR